MAKSSYSKVDEYGFERPENFNYESYDQYMSQYFRILTRRSQRWNTLKGDIFKKPNTLKRFVRKGIPSDRRTSVWMHISGADNLKRSSKLTYNELKMKINNRNIIDTIQIDLPRTFPDNIYFSTHEYLPKMLYYVLATFAHQNKEVGYCQGLNYIAGLLLLATKDEEASFWLLKVLVEQILPQYYIVTMTGLLTDLDVLDELVRKYEPVVHRHIHNIGMPWAMGTTKWFICLFSEVLPTETVFRIWDCLFLEGSKIIFRVALTLIRLHKENILLTSELGELITCFKDMRNHQSVINCHQFMTGEKIQTILKAANVDVEPYWPGLFAKALEGINVRELITNIGSGVGSAPSAGAAAPAAAAAAAEPAKEEKKKEEEPEESDDDMGLGLFD